MPQAVAVDQQTCEEEGAMDADLESEKPKKRKKERPRQSRQRKNLQQNLLLYQCQVCLLKRCLTSVLWLDLCSRRHLLLAQVTKLGFSRSGKRSLWLDCALLA